MNKRTWKILLLVILIILIGGSAWILISPTTFPIPLGQEWKKITRESIRIFGWEQGELSPEEKKIREEIVFKKMREASAQRDWTAFAPEYPRSKKIESSDPREKMKALENSPDFKGLDQELKEYLKKKENIIYPEIPAPSLKEALDFTPPKDKATEQVIERLLTAKKVSPREKPLEENLRLGMKGPLTERKIQDKPSPPQVKVKMETEIELKIWVLPDGTVDRIVPTVKGDPELERIAIQYLRQWRFAPLPKDQPQAEQWGTLPIKFRLQ